MERLTQIQQVNQTIMFGKFTNVELDAIIDAVKFGLHLNAASKKYVLAPSGLAIRKPGNYKRGSFKLTILLAVKTGDPAIPAI